LIRRAVCLNWARTDLWEARRATAGPTRPFYLDLFGNSSNSLFTKNRGVGTILNDD
jgi:hypothetical protein